MNKLKDLVSNYKISDKKAFVACLTAGYPDINSTLELSRILVDNGADIIELCIPFSDPVADGPTIQYSSEIALKKGASLKKVFVLADKMRKAVNVPVVFMSYLNPIYNMGLKKAFRMLKGRADGLIIPDTVPEESSKFEGFAKMNNISLIPLVAPNTPKERLKFIDSKASSFSYIVSLTGVTGERKNLASGIKEYLLLTKNNMKSPRYLGFGISKPEHVHQVKPYVDGIIVASAIINIIKESKSKKDRNNKVSSFVGKIRKALD
ncbi:MAG: tryptophan synthase subunit alpha [Elusimicrobia bacterium]|nr:tryptophan synthase subunit alpha [Candidatus Liberimonas magnetica]